MTLADSWSLLLVVLLCAGCDEAAKSSDCTERSVEECRADSACTAITGFRYEAGRACWERAQDVACRHVQTCGDELTYAKGLDDSEWLFTSTCIPSGWDVIDVPEGVTPGEVEPACE